MDFRNEILIKFTPINGASTLDFPYNVGERVAQCSIERVEHIHWEEVDKLIPTTRGSFGSTGLK